MTEHQVDPAEHKKLMSYRPDIDGIRAIAVLFVVFFHAFPTLLQGGFIGVDMFFVISGFLISGIILEALHYNSFSYANFYARRIKRIFPALIIVLLACLVAGWFMLFAAEYSYLGESVAYGGGFISNIGYLWASGYFDVTSNLKPLLHLWSLGVEEQFYLIWPVLLVFLYKKTKKVPLAIMLLLVVSFCLDFFAGLRNANEAFYLPFTRFWELMAGAFLAYVTLFEGGILEQLAAKKNSFIPEAMSFLGLLSICIPAFIIKGNGIYIQWTLLAVAGVFLLIAAGPDTFINKHILSNKILVFIGLISYPLYLWHWPLLSFASIIGSGYVSPIIRAILVMVSFILAWLTYIFIEKPIRKSKSKFVPAALFSAMLAMVILGLAVYWNKGFDLRFPKQEASLEKTNYFSPLTWNSHVPVYTSGICETYQKIIEPNPDFFRCAEYGNSEKYIFVVGDSHSNIIFNSYKEPLSKKGYTIVDLSLYNCIEILSETDIEKRKPDFTAEQHLEQCRDEYEKITEVIKSANVSGVIISNNSWLRSQEKYQKIMEEELSLLPKNVPTVWFLQTPRMPFNITHCVNRPLFSQHYSDSCYFPRTYFDWTFKGYGEAVAKIIGEYPYVITVDPAKVLCPSGQCPVLLKGSFLYNDDTSHLSSYGGWYVASRLSITQYFRDLTGNK